MHNDIIYDIEVYPNIFSCVMYSPDQDQYHTFEVSERKNDFDDLCSTLVELGRHKARMVGYNNIGYDYPVLHHVINLWRSKPDADWKQVTRAARSKNDDIINGDFDNRFAHIIWANDQIVEQVDLMKIHHFDNAARATSLKAIEFVNRSENIGDLPYDPNHPVPVEGFDDLLKYNKHDVTETFRFYKASQKKFALREELGSLYKKDFTNHNDTKIGKDIFIMKLEENDIACFAKNEEGRKRPRQTIRKNIPLGEIIFDYVRFERREFKAILKWFRKQIIKETKGAFTEIPFHRCHDFLWFADKKPQNGGLAEFNVVIGGKYRDTTVLNTRAYKSPLVGGLKFVFGTGGLHASVDSSAWYSDEQYVIVDVDVSSYYPWLAIANRVYPEHLGEAFCDIYKDLYDERKKHAKGTAGNDALKLALNGVYGDSNNQYSPFYDPKYTMAITVNGQLSLCMLAERFLTIPDLQILQVNTDGITVKMKRTDRDQFNDICDQWSKLTGLTLEEVTYNKMFIGNVNNYLAIYEDGRVKRKGEYEYELGWHQNHSQKVVAKAVEAHLVHGVDVRDFIHNHEDKYDFYMLAKCDRSSRIVLRTEDQDIPLQRNNRYYASNRGGKLIKMMPPIRKKLTKALLNDFRKLKADFTKHELEEIDEALKSCEAFDIEALRELGIDECKLKALELCQPQQREIGMTKDSFVTVHNEIQEMTDINYDYYVREAHKIINQTRP